MAAFNVQETFISVGSNIGNREANIAHALGLLAKIPGVRIVSVSSFIETEAVGGPQQPKYLNGAVKILTKLPARRLLAHLNSIEKNLGRTRTIKNGPRTIDLDILIFGNEIINEPDLVIPHPRMLTRDFVMKPLLEIAPQLTRKWISQKILHRHRK
ncbi:MAG: 2-amino-4-hydroxy-6-hydroxymethyldihydropteridine diphosphokinase [Candidatus Omnitrophota bacterium]